MPKAMTKAQRRRDERRRFEEAANLGLAAINTNRPHREAGKFAERPEDATRTVLDARVRVVGGTPSQDARKAVRGPFMASPIGVALHLSEKPEMRDRLWGVYADWCRADATYRSRMGLPSGNPQGATIQMQPERQDTETAVAPDLRTPEERDNAAVAAWMRWNGYLYSVDGDARGFLHRARQGNGKELHNDGKVTKAGRATIAGLKQLAIASGVDIG